MSLDGESMPRPLKLGFLCPHNPWRRDSFSGTPYFMLAALQAHPDVEVQVMGDHPKPRPWDGVQRRLGKQPANPFPDVPDDSGLDAIIALTAFTELERFGDRLQAPVFYVTDSTTKFLREFFNVDMPSDKEEREAQVIEKACWTVFSSQYMVDRAQVELGTRIGDRVSVIPFGANLQHIPAEAMRKPAMPPVRLLFIGKNWEVKGGDVAVATVAALRDRGHAAQLTVIGTAPARLKQHPDIIALGHLSKDRRRDMARLEQALREAHLFILPTQADCTPIVVSEANAFGCPVLISDVGGVGSLIQEGQNGYLMPLDAPAEAYADRIEKLVTDPAVYTQLSQSSQTIVQTHLNWTLWAERMASLIREKATA